MSKQTKIAVLIIVLILAAFGISLYFFQKDTNSDGLLRYNGFLIQEVESQGIPIFKTQIFIDEDPQPFLLGFRHHPEVLENIKISGDIKQNTIKKLVYVTMPPDLSSKATIAFSEIDRVLENPFLFNIPTKPALTSSIDGNDLPQIDCKDVTDDIAVIKFSIAQENRISTDEGCVILEAISEEDLTKLANRFTLTLVGIMDV